MKKFTEANALQTYLKEKLIESAKEYLSEDKTLEIVHETVYEWNGTLTFMIRSVAKENTGMLFLTDKTIFCQIGRRGGVKTKNLRGALDNKDESWKVNKYCIVIL